MKNVPITEAIKADIIASVGEEVDFTNLMVFEAAAVTTRPIVKPDWSIFKGAVIAKETLDEAANLLNSGTFVPLHVMHDQGYELPVGRVFKGGVTQNGDGSYELRTLFYTDGTEPDLTAKINAGSLEEVSIGLLAKKLKCSGCGFDFKSSDQALWDRTCENGHTLGMGDHPYHLILDGVDKLMELSLVSKGASTGAKILPQRQRLLASQFAALAATCNNVEQKTLFASPTLGEEIDMKELDELKTGLAALTEKVTAQAQTITELTQANTDLTAKLTAQTEAVAKLTTESGEKLTALQASVDEVAGQKEKIAALETKLGASAQAPTPAPAQPFRLPIGGIQNLQAAAQGEVHTAPTNAEAFKTANSNRR